MGTIVGGVRISSPAQKVNSPNAYVGSICTIWTVFFTKVGQLAADPSKTTARIVLIGH